MAKVNDSIEARFMKAALSQEGASTLTKTKMTTTFKAFERHARLRRFGDVRPVNLTEKQLKGYLAERAKVVSARTVQCEASHLRRAMRGVGRGEQADAWSGKRLEVPAGTRIGKGRPVDPVLFAAALDKARPEERAWLLLERHLGLRQNEMIEAYKALKTWETQLERGQSFVSLRDGAKGGRYRDIHVPEPFRERALEAVRAGLTVTAGRQFMVDSTNPDAARQQVQNRFSRLGLKGEDSGHSLRRAFAWDMYHHYRAEGLDKKAALSRLSQDLGHGERGRWVENNYLKGLI